MHILQLVKLFFPPETGGIEVFVNEISKELSKHERITVCCAGNDSETRVDHFDHFPVYRAGSLGKMFSTPLAPGACRLLKQCLDDVDIVHFHLPNPIFNMADLIVRIKQPIVIHWHSDIVRQWYFMPFYKPFQTMLLRKAKRIVCTSPYYMESSVYLQPFRDKCVPVQLGINPEKFISNPDKEVELREKFGDKPIIFSLGRLIPYKGFAYLIKAAREIDAHIIIGGEGPLRKELEELIQECGVGDKVHLPGKLAMKDVEAYFKTCDMFVLPSVTRNEAFGIVQMEAMYYHKPVVSTLIPGSGVSWVNRDGECGFVVPPRDERSLARAINEILTNQELKQRFSANARQRYENFFHISRSAQKLLEVFHEVLEEG